MRLQNTFATHSSAAAYWKRENGSTMGGGNLRQKWRWNGCENVLTTLALNSFCFFLLKKLTLYTCGIIPMGIRALSFFDKELLPCLVSYFKILFKNNCDIMPKMKPYVFYIFFFACHLLFFALCHKYFPVSSVVILINWQTHRVQILQRNLPDTFFFWFINHPILR